MRTRQFSAADRVEQHRVVRQSVGVGRVLQQVGGHQLLLAVVLAHAGPR